jgi:hypothetical protein
MRMYHKVSKPIAIDRFLYDVILESERLSRPFNPLLLNRARWRNSMNRLLKKNLVVLEGGAYVVRKGAVRP